VVEVELDVVEELVLERELAVIELDDVDELAVLEVDRLVEVELDEVAVEELVVDELLVLDVEVVDGRAVDVDLHELVVAELEVDELAVGLGRLLDVLELVVLVAVVEAVEGGAALQLVTLRVVLVELVAVLDDVDELLVAVLEARRLVVVLAPASTGGAAGLSPGSRSTMTSTACGRTRTRAPRESAMSRTMRATSGVNCPVRTRSTGGVPGMVRGTVDVSVVPGRSTTMRADWSRVAGRARVRGSTVSESVTTTEAGGPWRSATHRTSPADACVANACSARPARRTAATHGRHPIVHRHTRRPRGSLAGRGGRYCRVVAKWLLRHHPSVQ
jgi:hypothetical protein